MGGCRWYIIPKEFTDDIVKYIENHCCPKSIQDEYSASVISIR
jgi:hypothetical protein